MSIFQKYKNYLLYFLILVYFCGAIGFVYNPGFFLPFTPFTLVLTSFIFLLFQTNNKRDFYISFLVIAIIGYFTEVLGARTGFIFGEYSYGKTLGLKILEVPLTISINWALLVTCGVLVCSYFVKHKLALSVIAALLTTLIDILIEKVAPTLDFWKFDNNLPGLHNSVGWFLISFVTGYFFSGTLLKGNKKIALIVLILQVFFFAFICLIGI